MNPNRGHDLDRTAKKISMASLLEVVGAAGAITLAIIGLAGIVPGYMMAIGVLSAGGAMALGAMALGAAYKEVKHETGERKGILSAFGGGVSLEFLAGAAAISLAIIALAGFAPKLLTSIAILCLGGGLIIGAGGLAPFAKLGGESRRTKYARGGLISGAALSAIVGAGAVVLGILGIIGVLNTWTLPLVAVLGVGGALFITASALGGEAVVLRKEAHNV